MDQFNAMKAFCRTYETGSFSAAAAEINVAHTVISKQVRQLEQQLGVQLFNRNTRKLGITDAGRSYYEHARPILASLEIANLAVSQHHTRPQGKLRINAPFAFGTLDLAWWLPAFLKSYPGIEIDLTCTDRMVDLIDEGVDVTLRLANGLPDSSLMVKKLAHITNIVLAAPAYLQQYGMPQSPQDLLQHNCLIYTQTEKPDIWTFTALEGQALNLKVSGNFRANTSMALRAAALEGIGIINCASFIVQNDIHSGALLKVLEDFSRPGRELYAVYPHSRHLSPKVRAFIDFATQQYQLPKA